MSLLLKTNLKKFAFQEKPLYVTSAVHYHRIESEDLLAAAARNSGINEATIYDIPRSLLSDIDVTGQLMRGDAFLVAADKVHCNEPFAEAYLRVLKDSSHRHVELAVASFAEVAAVLAEMAVMRSAIGTDNISVSPS